MNESWTPAALALLSAARAIAGPVPLQAHHLLSSALRNPFDSLLGLLRENGLHARHNVEHLLVCLQPARDQGASTSNFEQQVAQLAGAVTPEQLVACAWAQDFPERRMLESTLRDYPNFLNGLGALESRVADARLTAKPGSEEEAFHPELLRRIIQAKAIARDGKVSVRTLLRVTLSDVGSVLSRGLLGVDSFDAVAARVGGKIGLPKVTQTSVDLACCNAYLRDLLDRAMRFARAESRSLADERDLALAFIAQTREERSGDLEILAERLEQLEVWLADQPSSDSSGAVAGEIPIDGILEFLDQRLINQKQATAELYRPVLRVRLGLGQEDELAGVYLFVGPPGVGKSYLGKLMAQAMFGYDPARPEANLVMIECGRYKDAHAVTDLIGAPLGYVDSNRGILRDGVREKAPCVIVFDEAEKMNPAIWDALLTILNDGVFRDNVGARYSLKDCVFVLTSNKGIEEAERFKKGRLTGTREDQAKADQVLDDVSAADPDFKKTIKRGVVRSVSNADEFWRNADYRETYKAILRTRAREHFGVAMVDRFDNIIVFNALESKDLAHIARIAIDTTVEHITAVKDVRLSYQCEGPRALPALLSGYVTLKENGGSRDIKRYARRFLLDDAFATLMLDHQRTGLPLAKAYRIEPKIDRFGALERVELVPDSAPAATATHTAAQV